MATKRNQRLPQKSLPLSLSLSRLLSQLATSLSELRHYIKITDMDSNFNINNKLLYNYGFLLRMTIVPIYMFVYSYMNMGLNGSSEHSRGNKISYV